ncbi:MAG TPA: universal stress protein [Candidatus Eisenbacteria bacterium]|nr:universal stress protein [Candidatus Eisenbacteria bacterium]
MKVLIGVDDSSFSRAAIEHVKQATWPVGTSFLVVSASAPVFVGPGEAAAPGAIAELIQQQEKFHRELADKAVAELKKAGLDAKGKMVPSDPRGAIVDTAKSLPADLVVVGSHGRSGLSKLLLGSVATHVVTHAPCNVLVVKSPG